MELFLLILAIFFLYKGVRALRRHSAVRKQGKDGPAPGAVRVELPRGAPAQWFSADKTPEVNGYTIPGGLVYVGGKLLDYTGFNDPCLINTDLKAEPGVSPHETVEDSFPDYGKLSPGQRGAYLSWLSGRRSDPSADIAYVFLFFYGLERRLLVDGQRRLVSPEERGEIVRELLRLLAIYGENRGFRGYCRNLLAVEWVLYGKPDEQPPYVDFSDRYCAEPFAAVLARYAAAEMPIPPDTALQWLILNPEQGLKTAARRCPDLFRKLFAVRYREKFGDGMIIRSTKTSLTLTYKAASPSLGDGLRLRIPGLPNPFILKSPLKKIAAIAGRCADELEAYCRHIAKGGSPEAPGAAALLPRDLLAEAPAGEGVRERLARLCGREMRLVEAEAVFGALGRPVPPKMDLKRSEELAETLETFGFGMAPDVRIHGLRPSPRGKIALFSPFVRPSSPAEFALAAALIRLGSLTAQAAGGVSEEEMNAIRSFLPEKGTLSGEEKASLEALLLWCSSMPQTAAGLRGVLDPLSPDEKAAMGRVLASVASADGRVDPAEVRQVEKLYAYLGLERDQAARNIHAAVTGTSRAVQAPQPVPETFSLDMDLIRRREEETRRVGGILRKIFSSEDEESAEPLPAPDPADPLSPLDEGHRKLLQTLLRRETWRREEYLSLCDKLSLPPDGALEIVNEWAFAAAGAPLAEDGDPIYIDIPLAEEVLSNGKQKNENPAP